MANRFGIPEEVVRKIKARDLKCVYCDRLMIYPYDPQNHNDSATIEHLREEGPFYWKDGLREEDLVMCCGRCNSNRSRYKLADWFQSKYCIDNKINAQSVAEPVKSHLLSLGIDLMT